MNTTLPPFELANVPILHNQPCQFAFQPIVDPARGNISSLEALIRGPDGVEARRTIFQPFPNINCTRRTWRQKAGHWRWRAVWGLEITRCHQLVADVTGKDTRRREHFVDHIKRNQLDPEQVIVEVTEDEMISSYDEFTSAIRQLRAAELVWRSTILVPGLRGCLCLPSFSRTNSRLTAAITDIHMHGPKQAIVKAIIDCCAGDANYRSGRRRRESGRVVLAGSRN